MKQRANLRLLKLIFVQRGVAGEFTAKLVEATQALELGNGLDEHVDCGPLVNARAVTDVDALVQATISRCHRGTRGQTECPGRQFLRAHDTHRRDIRYGGISK